MGGSHWPSVCQSIAEAIAGHYGGKTPGHKNPQLTQRVLNAMPTCPLWLRLTNVFPQVVEARLESFILH